MATLKKQMPIEKTSIMATEAARLHIEKIRTQKFSIGAKSPNPLTEDLHHAVTSLSAELYAKDVHFLMELIQVHISLPDEYLYQKYMYIYHLP